jgi:hypothetical protein
VSSASRLIREAPKISRPVYGKIARLADDSGERPA